MSAADTRKAARAGALSVAVGHEAEEEANAATHLRDVGTAGTTMQAVGAAAAYVDCKARALHWRRIASVLRGGHIGRDGQLVEAT